MVTMTERAAAEIVKVLAEQEKPNSALRIWIAGSGCGGYQYGLALDDLPGDDDLSFDNHGLRLLVDPMSHEMLDGAEIDFIQTPMGGGFKINNPNAKGGCNCGSGGCDDADCSSQNGGCGDGCHC